MTIDFSEYLGAWGLGANVADCFECGNLGYIATQTAFVTIDIPCPACPRSDWLMDDAAAGWAEQ